jgi:hypothetical protein
MKHIIALALLAAALASSSLQAQTARTFKARLSLMPLDLAMTATMAGSGSLTATLSGSTLTLNGRFQGLKSPATIAQLHKGQRGVRGPAVLDLQATKAVEGTISATITLTPSQLQDLQNSRLYVQLHSEKAPDGNLWGWLLPEETKR